MGQERPCGRWRRPELLLIVWVVSSAVAMADLSAASQAGRQPGPPGVADAAERRDGVSMRALVEAGTDVNLPQVDGATALHWAVHHDDQSMVEWLIRAGADVSVGTRYGVTPLALACVNGSAAVIQMLLGAGADPNTAQPEGETALMTAARTGRVDAVRVLLAYGADVNRSDTWRGQTALMWAMAQRHAVVARALIEAGADLHARSTGGFTPLLFAVRARDLESARVAVAAGADVNATLPDGTTPVMLAIINAHYELAAWLLDQGADPNADTPDGTALHGVVRAHNLDTQATPNRPPAGDLDTLGLIDVLLAKGGDINARLSSALRRYQGDLFYTPLMGGLTGATPLMLAASAVDVALMRLLVAHGADPAIPTVDGTTMVMMAAGIGHDEGRQLYWKEPASLDAVTFALGLGGDVHATNDSGNTALHGAALTGANSVVQFLVDHGAGLDVTNMQGWMPVDLAEGVFVPPLERFRPETSVLLRRLMDDAAPK